MTDFGKYTLEIMSRAGWYNNWLFSFIKPHCSGNILEVGVGIGNFTELLCSSGKLTSIDINKSYIDDLKKVRAKGIDVGLGDIEKGKYFFKGKKFDSVTCLNVLEHIRNDEKALRNINILLNPGGKLILLVPAHMWLMSKFDKNIGHHRRYSKKEATDKLRGTNFKIVKVRYLNWWAALGWVIIFKLGNIGKMPKSEVSIFNKLGRILLWPEKFIDLPFGLSVLAIAEK